MFKRIVCFLSAVIVMTSSVFAWDAYSFTGVYDVVSSAPPILYADSFSNSLSGADFMHAFTPTTMKTYAIISSYHKEQTIPGIPGYDDIVIPEFTEQRPVPADGVDSTLSFSGDDYLFFTSPYIDLDSDLNNGEFDGLCNAGNYIIEYDLHTYSCYYQFDFDVSSFGQFNCFSFTGSLRPYFDLYPVDEQDTYFDTLELYVNGSLVQTFSSTSAYRFEFNNFIYDSTTPISSIQFRFISDFTLYDSSITSAPVRFVLISYSASFSILTGSEIINGNIDQAQDDINDHESIESQWTGSMSSNFDALDMDSFSFPSGLLSGFSLITGIFQDLWNGMGDYKILYVFPLFLGIALLLIGRISKFSGGQSSSRSNRGDDDA